ncbi:DUF4190 domain-containing protein [Mycobacterium shimoidei]|uniref:DUF4190 domain-containing protein n=1 Tax=Mycobacterium shimoidei TaxID=29313 RepID=A0A1E3TF47_MYCSH|nr:DUF4190 domain-containing protein [Mycobacterium shimoidei]MCV7260289.1 DUF4190 domain-containing protein [Mycobacterium shimoidei]ODR12626.1 hypothetical protein BHQ16_14620 [Mycobacterium shimoidei]ORW82236.1 hypothetical protein AWC26_06095 [Mycobacterium shimoidei]SRX95359.1 hypothetical protein MSP7336_03628 [Mycobacterium shimoidei]
MTEASDKPPNPSPGQRENPEEASGSARTYQYQQAPYPYPPSYPLPPQQPYFGYSPPAAPRNGLGIASLVLAIVALVTVWSVFGGVVLGIAAVVTGFLGWSRVRQRQANNGGVAIAGIALGALGIVVGLAFIGVWVALWKDAGGDNYFDCLQRAGADRDRQQHCVDQFREKVQDRFGVTGTPRSPIR